MTIVSPVSPVSNPKKEDDRRARIVTYEKITVYGGVDGVPEFSVSSGETSSQCRLRFEFKRRENPGGVVYSGEDTSNSSSNDSVVSKVIQLEGAEKKKENLDSKKIDSDDVQKGSRKVKFVVKKRVQLLVLGVTLRRRLQLLVVKG